MFAYVVAAVVAVPIVEIAVFIEVGGAIGLWPTLAVVVATAIAGATLLRLQGLATLARAREALARNEMPLGEVIDGVFLLVAGALLLTPGFVTDGVGFALFVPGVRAGIRALVSRRFVGLATPPRTGPGPAGGRHGPTIDGEFHEVDPEPPKNRR